MTPDQYHREGADAMRDAETTSDNVSFQERVDPWMQACFGAEISADKLERGDRLLEEVLELLQSGDYPSERIASLTKYVWSREIGEPAQEVGGVMVTLAAYYLAHGLNMHTAGETELTRIWTKVDKIRAKQAAKPKGSVFPQAWPESNTPDALSRLVKTARALQPYLDWTIGPESPGYHPTMASAVTSFKEALAAMETDHDHA